jgi:hypothetical protein
MQQPVLTQAQQGRALKRLVSSQPSRNSFNRVSDCRVGQFVLIFRLYLNLYR